jgi:hypothetical protein
MADCASCGLPIGHQRGRCKRCGACEECCECSETLLFTPAELGLDPDQDAAYWQGQRDALKRRGI